MKSAPDFRPARRAVVRADRRATLHGLSGDMRSRNVVRELPRELDDFDGERFRAVLQFAWCHAMR